MSNNIRMFFPSKSPSLPEEGWLQECLCCKTITGEIFIFETIYKKNTYTMEAFLCYKCNKIERIKNKVIKYSPKFIMNLLNQNHPSHDL